MKFHKSIWLLFIAALFISGTGKHNRYRYGRPESKWSSTKSIDSAAYEVRLSFTGYLTFFGKCPGVGDSGTVVLTGVLRGNERPSSRSDVLYEGKLQLEIAVDICSAANKPSGEAFDCIITVGGKGLVKTELVIGYDGRGGYIQIKDTTSSGFTKKVTGTCDPEQLTEERTLVPLKSISSVFNGMELPMLSVATKLRDLKVNQKYEDHMENGIVAIQVLRRVAP